MQGTRWCTGYLVPQRLVYVVIFSLGFRSYSCAFLRPTRHIVMQQRILFSLNVLEVCMYVSCVRIYVSYVSYVSYVCYVPVCIICTYVSYACKTKLGANDMPLVSRSGHPNPVLHENELKAASLNGCKEVVFFSSSVEKIGTL